MSSNSTNTDLTVVEDKIVFVVQQLQLQFGQSSINPVAILNITLQTMTIAKRFSDLSGPLKKAVVCEALLRFINNYALNIDGTTKQNLIFVIQELIPYLIDMFVAIGRQAIEFDPKPALQKCWHSCCK